ncbi:MAG TPA: DUF2007 domain-containing protein [Anaeromyxobacter sp.]|nr:DUF2007 domain-containing protein [Anaeromyxobacter sp.]
MARDGWATVASLLRAEEAEMVRGVLESAGIEVLLEDAAISALNPLLQSAVGGAKVLVPAADAERATAVISESGVVPGSPGEAAEIPEEEWSGAGGGVERAPPERAGSGTAADAGPGPGPGDDGGERAAGHALRASFAALALALTVVVPLYALSAAARALRGTPSPSRRARRRRTWALAVSALALALGLSTWAWVVPAIRQLEPEQPAPYGAPERRPRPPNPARP